MYQVVRSFAITIKSTANSSMTQKVGVLHYQGRVTTSFNLKEQLSAQTIHRNTGANINNKATMKGLERMTDYQMFSRLV